MMADDRTVAEVNSWLSDANPAKLSDALLKAIERLESDQRHAEAALEANVARIGQGFGETWQSLQGLQESLEMIDSQATQASAAEYIPKESLDLILQIEMVSSTKEKLEIIERYLERIRLFTGRDR